MNKIVYVGKHALTMTVSRHIHSTWELIFCTSGSGRLIFDDRVLHYSTNDIAVIPPRLPHANRSVEGFTNIHINLTDSTLTGPEPMIIHCDPNGFLLSAFQAAFYYYSRSEEGRTLLPVYGQLIAALLAQQQPGRQRSEVVHEIECSILQNYPDCRFDLSGYLRSLPFNCEYLKKLFKKETGMTPHQYLMEKRLESAANALTMSYGKGSITDTARLCGFSEPLYFSRLFKKKYGVSPRQYAQENPEPPITDSDTMKLMP